MRRKPKTTALIRESAARMTMTAVARIPMGKKPLVTASATRGEPLPEMARRFAKRVCGGEKSEMFLLGTGCSSDPSRGVIDLRWWRCDARSMRRGTRITAGVMVGLSCSLPMAGQDSGNWRPVSTTAKGITGPVVIANETMVVNFVKFPIAEIRRLTAAELLVVATADSPREGSAMSGHLYRLSVPADQKFLHKNTLCGGEETQWMTTAVQGKMMQIAFFSQAQMPIFTAEAMATTTNLCGTFLYTK